MTLRTETLERRAWDEWYDRLCRAFGGPTDPADVRALWRDLTEIERSLVVWDDAELVGTASSFSFRVSVPGERLVPAAGVTMVSVQSTHRRRGVLTAMMRRQLDGIRRRGEPLAVLTASEPAIYGRFGYGLGTRQMTASVDTARVGLDGAAGLPDGPDGPDGPGGVRLRITAPAEAVAACEAVYARVVPGRPGMPARAPGWERVPLLDPVSERDGAGELLCVLAERDGAVTGYARYAVKARWSAAGPEGVVVLRDLEALDAVTRAALWRYLWGVDLTSTLTCGNLPADDPLPHLVSDPRRCRLGIRDGMFVRLVDVRAALAARAYSVPVDLVLEVRDDFCPWNTGRWRLSGDAAGAVCEPTGDPADLTLTARELGTAYLGGFPLTALAAAGRVAEARPGALRRASLAFRGAVEPWLPHVI